MPPTLRPTYRRAEAHAHRLPALTPLALLFVVLVAACGLKAGRLAPPEPPSRTLVVPGPAELTTYDNGITVLVVPDPHATTVRVELQLRVGSRDEPSDKPGLATFVGHLLQELPSGEPGSPSIATQAYASALEVESIVSPDETRYSAVATPDDLAMLVQHAARRLSPNCATIEDASFAHVAELLRVQHQRDSMRLDTTRASEVVAAVYPADHPYGPRHRTTIAAPDFSREEVCAFIDEHVTSDRAAVVVTGDVDPDLSRELLAQVLGPVPARQAIPRAPVAALAPATERIVLTPEVGHAQAFVLFSTPAAGDRDETAAKAAWRTIELSVALALQQKFDDGASVSFVDLGGAAAPLPGLVVQARDNFELEPILDEVFASIDLMFSMPLDPAALDRVVDSQRLQLIDGLANTRRQSSIYSRYLRQGAASAWVGDDLTKLASLHAAEVQAAGQRLFGRDRATLVIVRPAKVLAPAPLTFNPRAFRPTSPTVAAVAAMDPETSFQPSRAYVRSGELSGKEFTLDNGMKVILARSSVLPVMDARIVIDAGILHTRRLPDVAPLASELYHPLEWQALPALQFFGQAGGSLRDDTGLLHTTMAARGLSIYFDFMLSSLAHHVIYKEYAEARFERWQETAVHAPVAPHDARARLRAGIILDALYGEEHAFAQQLGVPQNLAAVTKRQPEAFHNQHYRAARSTLVVTGGIDLQRVETRIRMLFEHSPDQDMPVRWSTGGTSPRLEIPPIEPQWGLAITEVDEAAAHTQLTVVYPFGRVHGPHHASLLVLAQLLQQQVDAVASTMQTDSGVEVILQSDPPMLAITTTVPNERAGEHLATLQAAILAVAQGPDFLARFALAQRYVLAALARDQGNPHRLAERFMSIAQYGGSVDDFYGIAQDVATLAPEELQKQSDLRLPGHAVYIVHGPTQGVDNVTTHNNLRLIRRVPSTDSAATRQ